MPVQRRCNDRQLRPHHYRGGLEPARSEIRSRARPFSSRPAPPRPLASPPRPTPPPPAPLGLADSFKCTAIVYWAWAFALTVSRIAAAFFQVRVCVCVRGGVRMGRAHWSSRGAHSHPRSAVVALEKHARKRHALWSHSKSMRQIRHALWSPPHTPSHPPPPIAPTSF